MRLSIAYAMLVALVVALMGTARAEVSFIFGVRWLGSRAPVEPAAAASARARPAHSLTPSSATPLHSLPWAAAACAATSAPW